MTRFFPTLHAASWVPLNLSSGEMGTDLSFLQGIPLFHLLHPLDKEAQLHNHMEDFYILSKWHLVVETQEISTDFKS